MTVKGAFQWVVKAIKLFFAVLDLVQLLFLMILVVILVGALIWSVMLAQP